MSLTLRGIKGSALTHGELDNNFIWLSSRDIVAAVIDSNSNLILTKEDSSYYSVPLSGVNTYISGLTFSGNVLTITQSDGVSVSVNISSVDIRVTDLVYSADTLILYQSDGSSETVLIPQFSGGTINGPTNFTNGLSANTFNTTSLTLNGVTITGFTNYVFTGNTSGDCITDLFVSNVNSCSPLHIQNISSGDVYIGENGNVNVGIGTSSPTAKLHINNVTTGNTILLEDFTNPDSTPFVIDNNGSVGIGTLTPNATLDIKSPNDFINSYGIRWFNSGSTRGLNIDNDGSLYLNGRQTINWANNNSFTALDIIAQTAQILNVQGLGSGTVCIGPGVADSNTKLHIKGVDSSSSNYGLKVQNSGGTDNLVVRNDGNVGIRVSNPLFPLHVNLNTNENILFRSYDAGFGSVAHFQTVNDLNSAITPINFVSSTYYFTGFQAKMWIGDAYLANPTARVHIKGTDSTSSNHALKIDNSSNTPLLYVRNDGNVGIGTASPSESLDVTGKTKTANFQMTSGATTTGYVLTDSDGSGNAQWRPASGITGVGNVFKYTTNLTFTDNETKTVTHNLNTKFIHCSVWDYSTEELVTAQVLRNGVNAVNITIATAGSYDILITG